MKLNKKEFDKQVKNAESKLDRLISLKILVLLIILSIVFIILYGQLLTAGIMFCLYLYQSALINKFKKQIIEIKEENKNE